MFWRLKTSRDMMHVVFEYLHFWGEYKRILYLDFSWGIGSKHLLNDNNSSDSGENNYGDYINGSDNDWTKGIRYRSKKHVLLVEFSIFIY